MCLQAAQKYRAMGDQIYKTLMQQDALTSGKLNKRLLLSMVGIIKSNDICTTKAAALEGVYKSHAGHYIVESDATRRRRIFSVKVYDRRRRPIGDRETDLLS